jgi:hypothetical protein
LTSAQAHELYVVVLDGKKGTSKLNRWAHRVKEHYKKARPLDEFLKENGVTIDEKAYSFDEPCCYQLWDKETEGLKDCGQTGTREVKRGKYVCPEHDLFRM